MRTTYCTATLTVNDTVYSWTKSEIKTASITEEVDPSCMTLPINEATVCVIDEDKEFDITNTTGAWNDLEYDQPLVLAETVDGETVDCGTYYLDGWKYASNLATFTAVDAIGYIARRTYPGGYFDGETASNILGDIMTYAEYYDYAIDTSLSTITLTGFLPSSDCREALRCLCLALGAVADCRRSSTISITTKQSSHSENIGTDRKFYGNTSAELDEAVATLSFSVPIYEGGTETETLFSQSLPAGTHTLTLDPFDPDSIEITGSVSAYGIMGCQIKVIVSAADTITITGIKYTATNTTFSATTTVENFSDFPETKTYTCPLYNLSTMQDVMASLLEYWQLRKSVKLKYLLTDEISGDWVNVVDEDSQASTIRIESQTIDLAGGFISTAQCRGYTGDVFDTLFSSDDDDDDDTDGGNTGGTDDGDDDDTDGGSTGGDTGDGGTDTGDSGGTTDGDDEDDDVSTLSLGVYCDEVDETTDGVNFYDNLGRCVYSYSWDDIEEMTALPDLPMFSFSDDMTDSGFDDLAPTIYPEGWNWNLDSIQAAHHTDADSAEILDVGCTYFTNEEQTVYLFFAETEEVTLYFSNAGATIDWGDGSDEETATAGENTHTYDAAGSYVVKLSGGVIYLGDTSTDYGSSKYSGVRAGTLKYAIISGDVTLRSYVFDHSDLIGVYMASAFDMPTGMCYQSTDLTHVTMGAGTAYPPSRAFALCTSLTQALFSSETGAGGAASFSSAINGNAFTPFCDCPLTRLSLDMNGLSATFGNVEASEIYLYGTPATSSSAQVSFTLSSVEKISGLYWPTASPASSILTSGGSYCLYSFITDLVNIQGIYADMNLGMATGLTYESAIRVLNALDTNLTGTLTFAEETYALLSEDDIAIGTGKGWTVAYV